MSTLILLVALAGWAVVGTWAASRWVGIVPPPLDDLDDDERWPAVQAFLGLQAAANVARWRRVIVTGGLVLIVLVWGVWADEGRDRQREVDACETRVDSRRDVRAAIVAGDDELLTAVSDEFRLDVAEERRARVVARVGDRVYVELPPPDC